MGISMYPSFRLKKREITNTLLKSIHNRLDEAIDTIREKDPVFYKNCNKLFALLKQPQSVWERHLEFYKDNGQKIVLYSSVVFHNTALGPPKGGVMLITPLIFGKDFFKTFDSFRDQRASVEETWKSCCKWVTEEIEALSVVTTLKLALYSLPLGGAMCGVFLGELKDINGEMFLQPIELAHDEKQRLFREIGYLLTKEGIMGYNAYSPGPDFGTDETMMDSMADGHFRALAETEEIKEKGLLERLKNIRDSEIIWTAGMPYLKVADEFSKNIRKYGDGKQSVPELGAVTSKTYSGLEGRTEATAFAAVEITNLLVWYNENPKDYLKVRIGRERKNYLEGKTIVIQGFGKVGLNAANYFSLMGAKVVAISEYDQKQKKIVAIYNIQGLNMPALVEHKEKRGSINMFEEAKIYEDPCQLLEEKADILFLAAIENQITVYNAFNIQANYVVSAVNGGITQEGYHILRENRKIVGSDSIVKSGGTIASYLEKIQNAQNDKWEKEYVFEDIIARIENVLKNNVIKNQVEKHSMDMSLAGDVVAIRRIVSTIEAKYLQRVKKTAKKPIIIGIFDSGQGGIIVAEKLYRMLSESNIKLLLLTDKANFPFGQKTQDEINKIAFQAIYEINERCRNIKKTNVFFNKMFDKIPHLMKCLLMKLGIVSRDIIVCFACNTVDTLVDHRRLRKRFPQIQFIGPVQNTIAKIKKLPLEAKIGVIGTVGTIKSGIYEKHIREAGYSVIVKSTPLLAVLSEMLYKKSFDTEEMQKAFYRIAREIIQANLEGFIKYNKISHICLACTHYDYLKATIKDIFGELQFISTVETVIDEVENLLKQLPLQLGERELEFVKRAKKGRDFDRLILEEIILSQNLTPNEKVRLGEMENQIKDIIQNKLEGIRAEEIEDIKFFDSKSVKVKSYGKEWVISLFPRD